MRSFRAMVIVATVIATMSLAGAAFAQSAPDTQPDVEDTVEQGAPGTQGGVLSEVVNPVAEEVAGAGSTLQGPVLPFTGGDVVLFVVIGLLAVGSGSLILRRTRAVRA